MHFDRRHVPGSPDAGFIGADIEVVALTGTRMTSATEDDESFNLPLVPFAGYPTTALQASEVMGGEWKAGWLFSEQGPTGAPSPTNAGPSLTSSFSGHVLKPALTQSNVQYHVAGVRGERDLDYAVVSVSGAVITQQNISRDTGFGYYCHFLLTGSQGLARSSSLPSVDSTMTAFQPHDGADLNIAFVAKHRTRPSEPQELFVHDGHVLIWNPLAGNKGWKLLVSENDSSFGSVYLQIPFLNVSGGPYVEDAYTPGCWFVCVIAVDRKNGTGRVAVKDLSTGILTIGPAVSTATYTAMTGSGLMQMFGYSNSSGYNPPRNFAMSALYMGCSTGSAADMSTEAGITRAVNGLANCILSPTNHKWSGSLDIQNSIGPFGTADITKKVNRDLLGLGTGSLGYAYSSPTFTTTGSTIPSWTNDHLGQNAAFVIPTLSSSDHEVRVLNAFRSGTYALEDTAVPASATMYYSKKSTYRHVTVKLTASVINVYNPTPSADGLWRPTHFHAGKGIPISRVTSSNSDTGLPISVSSYSRTPCVIDVPVSYSGKIADIKVWVEVCQVSGANLFNGLYHLGNLGIALRSPNVKWGHAHPIRNDPELKRVFASDPASFSYFGQGSNNAGLFGPNSIYDFYRDTFLIWEGTSLWERGPGLVSSLYPYATVMCHYPGFQLDRGMRTVFADSAPIKNPRHNYGAGTSASYVGAPNSYFGFNNAWGFDVPWTSETEYSGSNTYALAGSPPRGWLTGPGGTNGDNEWPTTGSNYGADYIRPQYPLLDPIYQRKVYGDEFAMYVPDDPTIVEPIFRPEQWTGYRPGLRGTEASGTWQLVLIDGRSSGIIDTSPSYFRQVRLEFTLYSGSDMDIPRRSETKQRPWSRKNEQLLFRMSGTDAVIHVVGARPSGSREAFVSETYLFFDNEDKTSEIGRTFGVSYLTGSIENSDAALFYRLTGTLADLSGGMPGWLLNNEFGMPMIPLSSASLVEPSSEDIISIHPQDIMTVRPLLDGTQRLSDAAKDASPPLTRAQYAVEVNSDDDTDE
jgi:hypothetical protein